MQNLLLLWAGDALKKERKMLIALENSYNSLTGGKTHYVLTHDAMIEARRKVIKIWESVVAAEKKNIESANSGEAPKNNLIKDSISTTGDKSEPADITCLNCGEKFDESNIVYFCIECAGEGALKYEGLSCSRQ